MIVTGNAAYQVCTSFINALQESNSVREVAKSPKYKKFLGGYYKEPKSLEFDADVWIAFDNRGCEFFIEEFDTIEEARQYASGIEARTKYGVTI